MTEKCFGSILIFTDRRYGERLMEERKEQINEKENTVKCSRIFRGNDSHGGFQGSCLVQI